MKEEKLNSLAVAIFLCANPLAWVFSFIPGGLVFIVVFSWLIVIANGQTLKIASAPLYTHIFILSTFAFFILSSQINRNTSAIFEYFSFFILFGITGVYFSHLKFSIKQTFEYIAIISVLLALFIYNIDFGDPSIETVDYGMWMGISYGSLRLALSLLVMLFLYYNDHSWWQKCLLIGTLIIYVSIYSNYATRGAMLAILFFCVSYFAIRESSDLKRRATMLVTGVLLLVVTVNFENTIISINQLLYSLNFEVKALAKIETLLALGNMDNGRDQLVKMGLEGILSSPIIGNGIAGFEEKHDWYVHNFLLQILYEGGILLLIPVGLVLVISIRYIYTKSYLTLDYQVFILFMFSAGLIELLFSNIYWKSVFFWFFIFFNIRLLIRFRGYDIKRM